MDDFKKKFLAEDLSMSPRDKAKRNRRVRQRLKEDLSREVSRTQAERQAA